MRSLLAGLAFAAVWPFSSANALPNDDALVKQSFLTISAFKCSQAAVDLSEKKRLFMLGYNSGRAFLESVRANPEVLARIEPRIAIHWQMVAGPTADFMLGQLHAQLLDDVKHEPDKELRKLKKDQDFRDMNCALIN